MCCTISVEITVICIPFRYTFTIRYDLSGDLHIRLRLRGLHVTLHWIKLLSHACVIVDGVKSHLNLAILVTLTVIYGKEKLFFVEYKFLASKDEKSTFNLFQRQYDKLMLTLEMSFCLLLKRKAKQGCSGLSRVL